ncbi:MAG TPA: PASTA domain-containing protein, partial [Thermoanaerobaculia bacterium]|nr:PASTA domain-containing protein [Thermoanaerobaculia bacterium]
KGAQYGGTIAAPAFKEIAEPALRYLGVAPSLPQRTIDVDAPRLAAFSQPEGVRPRAGVSDLRGLDARAAIARAVAAGLTVRATGSGVVASQNPLPGGALPTNHSVTLTLAEIAR